MERSEQDAAKSDEHNNNRRLRTGGSSEPLTSVSCRRAGGLRVAIQSGSGSGSV